MGNNSGAISGAASGAAMMAPTMNPWLIAGGAAVGFISGMLKDDAQDDKEDYYAAQYQQSLQQFAVDTTFYNDSLSYAKEQQSFQMEVESWGKARYAMAVADRAREVAYREEVVENKKFGAKVDFMAQKHVADILQVGANEQASNAVIDVLRVAQANKRDINLKSEQMMGTIVSQSMSGIAQGASKDRMIVESFMLRNRASSKEASKAKASIIKTVNQRNKVINDTNLQTAASYRGLEAIMKLKAAPVANVPPPAPVFTGLAPVKGVGPEPIYGGEYQSSAYTPGQYTQGFNSTIKALGSSGGQEVLKSIF